MQGKEQSVFHNSPPLSIAALASPYLNLKAMERGRG
jgi:hypothetical protein